MTTDSNKVLLLEKFGVLTTGPAEPRVLLLEKFGVLTTGLKFLLAAGRTRYCGSSCK